MMNCRKRSAFTYPRYLLIASVTLLATKANILIAQKIEQGVLCYVCSNDKDAIILYPEREINLNILGISGQTASCEILYDSGRYAVLYSYECDILTNDIDFQSTCGCSKAPSIPAPTEHEKDVIDETSYGRVGSTKTPMKPMKNVNYVDNIETKSKKKRKKRTGRKKKGKKKKGQKKKGKKKPSYSESEDSSDSSDEELFTQTMSSDEDLFTQTMARFRYINNRNRSDGFH